MLKKVLSWPALLALVVLVLFWRSHELILRPTMRVEDGARIFAYFHDHRAFWRVFRFKSGYLPLIPNLLGYLAVRLPPRASPYFMALAPTALSAFAYSCFFARRFRELLPDDAARSDGTEVIGCVPARASDTFAAVGSTSAHVATEKASANDECRRLPK